MKFLDGRDPTTKDLPKLDTAKPQQFKIAFGLCPNRQVGVAIWLVGCPSGPIYTGSIHQPEIILVQLIEAIRLSSNDCNPA
jgi:hypothetical protein